MPKKNSEIRADLKKALIRAYNDLPRDQDGFWKTTRAADLAFYIDRAYGQLFNGQRILAAADRAAKAAKKTK